MSLTRINKSILLVYFRLIDTWPHHSIYSSLDASISSQSRPLMPALGDGGVIDTCMSTTTSTGELACVMSMASNRLMVVVYDVKDVDAGLVVDRSYDVAKYQGYKTIDIRLSDDYLIILGEDTALGDQNVLIYRIDTSKKNHKTSLIYVWSVLNTTKGQYADILHYNMTTYIVQSTLASTTLSLHYYSLQQSSLTFDIIPDDPQAYCIIAMPRYTRLSNPERPKLLYRCVGLHTSI